MLPDLDDPHLLLAHAVPLVLWFGALFAGRSRLASAAAWRMANRTLATAWVLAASAALAPWVAGTAVGGTATTVVLLLVASIGWVIGRYAATYLAGEPNQTSFVRWLLATLGGAALVVATPHLGVLAAAWFATSLALQKLLTFYGDRPNALMAAHKKFLVSRLADVCMIAATALLATHWGTLEIEALGQLATTSGSAASSVRAAAVLLVVATLLKSAQLPFHGWLMQVMEAPTPVSALLHAGVVNLGGFVLIRLAPLVGAVPAAQTILVVVGSLTAVVAALATTTRISIKVALAWSTCAQMGFMVLQCGLGLHEMALLHLVAHSLYKAHAFLSAGGVVQRSQVRALTPTAARPRIVGRMVQALAGVALTVAASWCCGVSVLEQPALAAMALVVGMALAPLLDDRSTNVAGWLHRVAVMFLVTIAYFGLHRLLHGRIGALAPAASVGVALWAAGCFLALFVLQTLIAARPSGPRMRLLHDWFYGGLFLDEWFTRLTLRIWPIRPRSQSSSSAALSEGTIR